MIVKNICYKGRGWDAVFEGGHFDLLFPDPPAEEILKKFFSSGLSSCLDLGCGTGRHVPLLSHYFAFIVPFDISVNALLKGKEIFQMGNSVRGDMENLPFKAETFNCVFAWRVLHLGLWSKIEKTFQEIYRVLCPHGYFIGSVRNTANALYFLLSDNEKPVEKNSYMVSSIKELEGTIYHFFNDEELEFLLKPFSVRYMENVELPHTGYTRTSSLKNWFTLFCAVKK